MALHTSSRSEAQPRRAAIRKPVTLPYERDDVLASAFHRTLREICFTEKHSSRAYGRLAGKANSAALRQAMRDQQTGSARRVDNIIRVFGMIGKRARSETFAPICELMTEMECHVASACDRADNDAVLISWSQQLDYYRLGRYGLLKEWSNKLGMPAVEEALDETLRDVRVVTALLDKVVEDITHQGIGFMNGLSGPATPERRKVFVS